MVLCNLAIADVLILTFCLPLTIINDVTKTFWFSTVFCKGVLFIQVICQAFVVLVPICMMWRCNDYGVWECAAAADEEPLSQFCPTSWNSGIY
ncbi:hypothetical protein WR25_26789 [Diploscapter pachys]|uniref:G-protein coupled receptors family 1 profile domain-containing protein n=1 Tax=Diploscapter pachys TaxID=2018661 RepID=A0A2A2LX05_9BILA|nr:hypothetical protein WR25_26789 [Diploscapter pachys]